ncbi:CAR1 transcription factor-like, partial [Drosophila innubila]|uniref:CAR1 transcription factor-like n=1 Tax=Drosophila innubila TaxID=198719 RepID=UPI00148C8E2D
MLPANVGTANQTQTKRELPITMKLGSGGVASTLTVTPSVNGQSKGQEDLRYLPIATMPSKPCSITISNYNSNSNSNINNINNNNSNNIKTKLTPVNIVQKQLRVNNSTPAGTAPFIQLMTANSNGNSNSLLSILTPKAIINPTSNNSSNTNNNNNSKMQPLPHPQSQSQPVMIRPATTLTTIPVQQQNGAAVYNNNNNSNNNNS